MKRFLLILTGLLLSITGLQAQNPGDLDLTFHGDAWNVGSGANGGVHATAFQPDGKILIGGDFTFFNGTPINRIARLNADGSLDSSFNPGGANGSILTIALQPDGKILIGGFFNNYSGTAMNGIARLNADGSFDTSFNPGTGANSTVWTLALLPDGKILAGGAFTSYNGTGINGIARLNANGSLDTSFDPGTGVDFGVIDPNTNEYYGIVLTIVPQAGGKILIGGNFSTYNGISRRAIARLNANGSLDTSFNPGNGANGWIWDMILQPDGKILIGGFFQFFAGTSRNNIMRLNADGSVDISFNPGTGASGQVRSLALQPDGKILIGGEFTSYNEIPRNYIARINTDGILDTSFDPGTGISGGIVNPSTGASSQVRTITLQPDGRIFLGGEFTSYNGVPSNYIARINPNGSIGSVGSNERVRTIALQPDGKALIGGEFNYYNGVYRSKIARLNIDGSPDTSFDPGTGANNTVNSIALQVDGKILIGGEFTSYNGKSYNRIARLNADGSLDTSFNPGSGANNKVWAIALLPDGKIMVGGAYTSYNGTAINGIARLNANGSLDTTFNPGSGVAYGLMAGADNNANVLSIALQPDGKILIGGDFAQFNGITSKAVARLNVDGSLDSSFNPGNEILGWIWKIALQPGGKILLGGDFTSFSGTLSNHIRRLNADGSMDLSFSYAGLSRQVRALTLQPDGKILIGGEFTSYTNTPRNFIARLNENGHLDFSFDPGIGPSGGKLNQITGASTEIHAIALQPDGKILIGGEFTAYNGVSRGRIARLYGDLVADSEKPIPSVEILPDLNFQCEVLFDQLIIPTATDNVDGTIQGVTDQSIFPIRLQGPITITWTYTDEAGNTCSQTQNIIIDDTTAPVPTLAALPVVNGQCSTTVTAPTASDNCKGTITGTTENPLTYNEQGTYKILWTYNDGNGNTTTQEQTVIVKDSIVPVPTLTVLPLISSQCSTTVIAPTASDNCKGTITGTTDNPLTYNEQGTYKILWTYNDGNGNTTTQEQTVIVKDSIAPVPTLTVLPVINGQCSATVTAPTATDNCKGTISGKTEDPLTYSEQGTYKILWTYNDGNGNTTTQEQTVIVKGSIAPVPTLAALPVVNGQCSTTVTAPTASDNCKGTITGTTENPLTYNEQGTYKILWTYNDGNGNTTTQEQTVIVKDSIAPVPTLTVLPVINGQCSATVTAPTATDNCKGTISGKTEDPLTYSEQGTYKILWTYNDGNGNTTTQEQTVIVKDSIAPVPTLTVLPVINGQCSATVTAPTASDNCKGTITGTTENPLTYNEQGTYKILWTYNDGNGNTTTQEQTVIVKDSIAPVQTLTVLPVINGQCSATVTAPTASDNCKETITGTTENPLTYNEQGTYKILWTFNDGNGNTTTQEQTVIVKDSIAPEIQAPENLQITLEVGQVVISGIDLGLAVATDNCGEVKIGNNAPATFGIGTTSVIWTAEDKNGNVSTAVQLVSIIGKECSVEWEIKEYVTLHLNASGEATLTLSQINLGTTSKCGPLILMVDKTIFDCTNIGLNNILITASDGFGLKESKDIKVNVIDNIRPTLKLFRSSYPWLVLKGKSYTIPDLRFLAIVDDNCGYDLQQFPAPGTKFSKSGNIQVMFIAIDPAGNTSQRSLTIRLRLLNLKSLFNFRMEEIEDGSLIQVPWNTSLSRIQEEFLGLDKEVLQETEIKQNDYNPLQPGYYAVELQNKLDLHELGKNIIPISILVQDKPKALNIELSNQFIAKNVRAGTLIGTLSTIDPADNIHTYSVKETLNFAIEGNRLIWIGTEIPADQIKVTVFSTDRAAQTIGKEILIYREKGPNSFLLFPNPAQNQTNVRVDLDEVAEVEIKVFDVVGRLVIEDHIYREETFIQTLDLTVLAQGVYMVQVKIGHIIMTERLIKR